MLGKKGYIALLTSESDGFSLPRITADAQICGGPITNFCARAAIIDTTF
jgi:hypothetical protein